jgi:hypothetical protein
VVVVVVTCLWMGKKLKGAKGQMENTATKARKPKPAVAGHSILKSRSSGIDGWTLTCTCGWSRHSYRYICEEDFLCHLDHMIGITTEYIAVAHARDSYFAVAVPA